VFKRLWIAGVMILVTGPLLLLSWQPNALKELIINHVAKEVSESTPYELTIGNVSGNVFFGIRLHDVRFGAKHNHTELLRAPSVRLGINGWALLHKKILINRLDWQEPTLHLVMDENKHFLLPIPPSTSRSTSSLTYDIEEMTVENGRLIIVNQSITPEKELTLQEIDLKARINAQEIDIDRFQMGLDQGRVHMKGRIVQKPTPASQWVVEDDDFPLDRLFSLFGAGPAPFACLHSGEWKVDTDSGRMVVSMRGRLMKGPISLEGLWTGARIQRADMTWNRPGLAAAAIHIKDDEGSFQVTLTSGTMNARVQGTLNAPSRSVRGEGTATHLAWQAKRVDKADFTFFVNPEQQQVDLTAGNVRFDENVDQPFDLSSVRLSLKGRMPRWQAAASLKYRNGSSTDVAGSITSSGRLWRFDWHQLAIANSFTGSWSSLQPGYVTLSSNRSVEIHDLYLAH
jgi:uncharacterized protein involved in outer membrane biogenesis